MISLNGVTPDDGSTLIDLMDDDNDIVSSL